MTPLGTFDPDEEEATQPKQPAWMRPKTQLDTNGLAACRRKKFLTRVERKRWEVIQAKTLGANEEDYLYLCWVKYKIEAVAKHNAKTIQRNFGNLMAQIENEDARMEWTGKNRKRLLTDRRKVDNLDTELLTFKEGKNGRSIS